MSAESNPPDTTKLSKVFRLSKKYRVIISLIQNCASVKILAENLFCYQILVTL